MEKYKWEKFKVPTSSRKKVDLVKVFIGENSFMVIYAEIFYERKFVILCRNDAKFIMIERFLHQ